MKKTLLFKMMIAFTFISFSLTTQAESFIVEGEYGLKFKLWIGGIQKTPEFTDKVRLEVRMGVHKIEVQPEGSAERIKKTVSIMAGWQDVVYLVKFNPKKNKYSIKPLVGSGNSSPMMMGDLPNIGGSTQTTQSANKDGGVKFDWTFIDAGKVDQGGVILYDVNIKSSGSGPLEISDVTSSCQCMEVLNYPKSPIQPGHFDKIQIRITAPQEEGRQVEKLYVHGNTFMGKDAVNIEFHISDQKAITEVKTEPVATPPPPPPHVEKSIPVPVKVANTMTDNRDGNVYEIVNIGGKWWFAENLRYKAERSYKHQNASDIKLYGYLYSWPGVIKETLCPIGWHVSLDEDWKALESGSNFGASAGKALKSADAWDGDNTSNLNIYASGSGRRTKTGTSWKVETGDFGFSASYWSPLITTDGPMVRKTPISRTLNSQSNGITRKDEGLFPSSLFYCRCVKD